MSSLDIFFENCSAFALSLIHISVRIHAGQQDFPGTAAFRLHGPFHGIQPHEFTAAMSAVCKINIDSDGRLAMTAAIRLSLIHI